MLQLAQGTRRAAFGGRHAVVRKVRARAEGKAPEQSTGSVEEKGAAGDEKPAEERKPEPDAAGNVYIDELPKKKKADSMSKEMKAKLRKEYIGFGGSADQPLASNYFLYIILGISGLAILSKVLGYI